MERFEAPAFGGSCRQQLLSRSLRTPRQFSTLPEGEGLETGNIAPRQSFTRQRVFRDVKSLLETRPIYHQRDENIRGHVFCSFLALVLRKELEGRLNDAGHLFEWSEIKQDLDALQRVTILEQGKRFAIRTQCQGNCGKIFQAVGVAPPPTIREIR